MAKILGDLATPFGNLDHVVIGPTGVFILETKNWKGTITADGQVDILCNNTRLKQATSKPLIVRMMNVRDKVKTLCDAWQDLPYFSAFLVFPSASVEAKCGQTGKDRCITDEQIWRCIVETNPERKLNTQEIERLSQAFRVLATMDKEFPKLAKDLENRPSGKAEKKCKYISLVIGISIVQKIYQNNS